MTATAFHEDYVTFKHDILMVETYTDDQLIALYAIYCAEMRHYGAVPEPEPVTVRPWIVFTSKPMDKKFSMAGDYDGV